MQKPILYSSPTCPPCFGVKKWLNSKGIEYIEKDIFENAQEVQELSGVLSPPTLYYNDTVVIGPNYSRLASVFER